MTPDSGYLLWVIAPIALLDSASMLPLCVVPLAAILGGKKPLLGASAFLGGIFLVYMGSGLVLLLALDALRDSLEPRLARWWTDPDTFELLLQLATGLALLGFGWKLGRAREQRGDTNVSDGITPVRGFFLGASLTIAGLLSALPYLGAVDQILRADLATVPACLALLLYNLVFLLPLALLPLVRALWPGRSERIFQRLASVCERWGRRLILAVLLVVGVVLGTEAIGWFQGHPLIPVG